MRGYIELLAVLALIAVAIFAPLQGPQDADVAQGMARFAAGFDRSLENGQLCQAVKAMAAQVPGAVAHCN